MLGGKWFVAKNLQIIYVYDFIAKCVREKISFMTLKCNIYSSTGAKFNV